MSIRSMIDAARVGNAVEFEKHFVNETQERLLAALTARRSQIVGDMFGLSEEEDCDDEDMKNNKEGLTVEESVFIESVLHELSEEDLSIIAEDEEALEMFIEQTLGKRMKTGAKIWGAGEAAAGAAVGGVLGGPAGAAAGAAAGAVGGAIKGAAMGAAYHGARKAGSAVKRGVKSLVNKARGNKAA